MTHPLRIAVDVRPLAFPNSGIGRYTACLLREFARVGTPHHFILYCDRSIQLPFNLPSHWRLRSGHVTKRAMSTPFAQAMFPLWALADRLDVFWSPRHHLPLLLPPHIRSVVTVHDMVWKRFPGTMTTGGRFMESLLMPASLHRADSIIAVSQFTRREIAGFFPAVESRIDVIYEASTLQTEAIAKVAPSPLPPIGNRPYFLFVGSSEPRKNLTRLLEAYNAYLTSSAEALDLVIAGSYQWGGFDAQQFVDHHNLGNRIHLLKEIDDQTLANLYQHARALVMPSLYEGFGLPLVEAMQWGIPIITSHGSAMAEVAGDAALAVDPLDTNAIRDALGAISENNELHERLADNSATRASKFDWRRAALQTLDVLGREQVR
jgi:glycosyltransferase involved in cell wall biosynthesis